MQQENIQFILNLIVSDDLNETIERTKADVLKRWPMLSGEAHSFITHVLVYDDYLEQAIAMNEEQEANETPATATPSPEKKKEDIDFGKRVKAQIETNKTKDGQK